LKNLEGKKGSESKGLSIKRLITIRGEPAVDKKGKTRNTQRGKKKIFCKLLVSSQKAWRGRERTERFQHGEKKKRRQDDQQFRKEGGVIGE